MTKQSLNAVLSTALNRIPSRVCRLHWRVTRGVGVHGQVWYRVDTVVCLPVRRQLLERARRSLSLPAREQKP